jgi:ABC-type glycerol-3-phosphate transport system permease component
MNWESRYLANFLRGLARILAVAPVILAGWLAQRSLVRGLTFGAVK